MHQQPPQGWQQTPTGWVPQVPPRRGRTPLYVALALAAALVLFALGLGASWFLASSPKEPAAVSSALTASVSSSPAAFDQSTLTACKESETATTKDDPGDAHGDRALGAAALSDVPTLRELAAKYEPKAENTDAINMARAFTGVLEISTWCVNHKLQSWQGKN